jgi:geranylgeranyl diphosphate synthase type II
MKLVSKYQDAFLGHLKTVAKQKDPDSLYEPVRYILSLGGKRLRPILTLIACDFFDHDYKEAMDAAVAVEVFHNFSLIHDDIMDQAPLRRGKQTVHTKWDLNTGILSGDAMLILAYQYFESYEPAVFRNLAMLFSKTALEVCEGQQLDIDFESRSDVALSEYIKMIEYKTAVLIGAAMKMGALVAGASADCCTGIYNFGKYLGIAFQLQDDYLDAFGDPKTFGKQVGGDILANKKTFLYIKAMQQSDPAGQQYLLDMFGPNRMEPSKKIDAVKQIFIDTGATNAIEQQIAYYTEMANNELQTVLLNQDKKDALKDFGAQLMKRTV